MSIDGEPNHTQRTRSLTRSVCIHALWFAMLFFLVAGLALYAVASSFPIPGGSEPRSGTAAIHESIGVVIMHGIHGPFAWLYSSLDGKTAGVLVWLFWAAGLYGLSALGRRPRWVFTPARNSNELGNA
jgi:amino acid permease